MTEGCCKYFMLLLDLVLRYLVANQAYKQHAVLQPAVVQLSYGVEWGTPCVAGIMLITLTVDGWCVLPVLFAFVSQALTQISIYYRAYLTSEHRVW
jgi:hypothetical protein